jgi:hypothetical protein
MEPDKELDELTRRGAHIDALEKIVSEFLRDPRVCHSIAKDCIGGHGEDPCKCLYCRAKATLGNS